MPKLLLAATLAAVAMTAFAQDAPLPTPGPEPQKKPRKARPRAKLLQDMIADLDTASPHAKVDAKGRKKLDKCHDTLFDAIEQQRRYKSVRQAKVNSCLDDLEKLADAGAFPDADRDRLRKDGDALAESVGKPRLRLSKPF